MKLDQKAQDFITQYLNTASPTGFEAPGQKVWLNYLTPYIDEHIVDTYGTVVGVINPGQDYKVVIEAHADEISWFVNYISSEGYLYVIRNGGSDHMIAPSMRVNLHTEEGPVPGIFGWPAIHVRNLQKEETPSMKNIFVDVGCSSKEEVEEKGIYVGCPITFADGLTTLNDRYYVGRALDNRIGGVAIAQVARRLKEEGKKLPFTLYVVNSVQEEIGLRGAEMIAARLQPDVALVTDVCHDTSAPLYNPKTQGDTVCGKGPVLTVGPAVQNNLLRFVQKAAQEAEIGFQRSAASRSTGTDTDAFAYSMQGVASALVSIPLKYMHTTVETLHEDDLIGTSNLLYETLIRLEPRQDFRYLQ